MGQLTIPVNDKDHFEGKADAPITLVEYGDYQCPHCGAAYPVIKKIQEAFPDQIKFVYRNFPLSESHPMAFSCAVATEAAALQGKFWEMHDIIFENQSGLSNEALFRMATKIGLDIEQFSNDIQKDTLSDKVEADFESGIRSGVNGTPSFFVNGTKFDGGAEDLFAMFSENAE